MYTNIGGTGMAYSPAGYIPSGQQAQSPTASGWLTTNPLAIRKAIVENQCRLQGETYPGPGDKPLEFYGSITASPSVIPQHALVFSQRPSTEIPTKLLDPKMQRLIEHVLLPIPSNFSSFEGHLNFHCPITTRLVYRFMGASTSQINLSTSAPSQLTLTVTGTIPFYNNTASVIEPREPLTFAIGPSNQVAGVRKPPSQTSPSDIVAYLTPAKEFARDPDFIKFFVASFIHTAWGLIDHATDSMGDDMETTVVNAIITPKVINDCVLAAKSLIQSIKDDELAEQKKTALEGIDVLLEKDRTAAKADKPGTSGQRGKALLEKVFNAVVGLIKIKIDKDTKSEKDDSSAPPVTATEPAEQKKEKEEEKMKKKEKKKFELAIGYVLSAVWTLPPGIITELVVPLVGPFLEAMHIANNSIIAKNSVTPVAPGRWGTAELI